MRRFLLSLFLFSIQITFTQDFKQLDSIVKSYPREFESIESFAKRIDSDFNSNIEKTRAAYYWISNNVSYDYKSANSVRISSYRYNAESELKKVQFEYAESILKKKTAICEGYSQLLKHVLDKLEVECEVVEGYAKTDIKEIGKVTNEGNHAWNAVFIDNKWQLIDATWSTGNEETKLNHFDFNDTYFLANPEMLAWSHFPDDKKWQLLEKPISTLAFFYSPIIHPGFHNSGLKLSKMRGKIKSQRKIQLIFDSINVDKTYYFQYAQSSLDLSPISFIKKGNKLIAEIPYDYRNGRELIIFDSDKACLSFRID